MKFNDFISVWDRRNVEGDIVGVASNRVLIGITPEQLRDMNIFDLACIRSHVYGTELITICDTKGNRMIVDSLNPYPSRYGFGQIRRITKSLTVDPKVNSFFSLPLMGIPGWADPGMLLDIDNKFTTVEKARAQ